MTFRRVLIIANPIAGRGQAKARAEALREGLGEAARRVELFLTAARGDAEAKARSACAASESPDLVVIVGGDGTVAEVLSGLDPVVPLGIHPMGTANVMGRDLGLPTSVDGTLAMLADGRRQGLDVARVNERLSFLVVGVGFDGAAVRDVEARRRGPITKWTYVRAVLRTLWGWKPPQLTVALDGVPHPNRVGWILVSNIVGYGGLLRLWSGRQLDDGLYEVFLFEKSTRFALVRYALAGLLGRLPGRHAHLAQARHVRVESDMPVPYQVDGDFGGETPVDIEITGKRFQLILPR